MADLIASFHFCFVWAFSQISLYFLSFFREMRRNIFCNSWKFQNLNCSLLFLVSDVPGFFYNSLCSDSEKFGLLRRTSYFFSPVCRILCTMSHPRWLPIESNPDVMNSLFSALKKRVFL
jgi:hypothetical protein